MRFTKILVHLVMQIATVLAALISVKIWTYPLSSAESLSKEIVQAYRQRLRERVYAFAKNADLFYSEALKNEPIMGPGFGFRNHQFAVIKHKEFIDKYGPELQDLRAKLKSCGAQSDKLDERLRDNRPDLMFIPILAQTLVDTVGSIPKGRPECGSGEEPGHFSEVSSYYVLNTEGNSYGWSEYDLRKRPSITVGGGSRLTAELVRGTFYVDVVIGDERLDRSLVEVHTNSVTVIPPMWDQNHKDDSVLEIVDQRGDPDCISFATANIG